MFRLTPEPGGASARRQLHALLAAALLFIPEFTLGAQVGSGSSSGGRSSASSRACASCPSRRSARDSARAQRKRLLLRLDTLRREFDQTRMDQGRREQLAQDMASTMIALQDELETMHASMAISAVDAEAAAAMAPAMAFSTESGFRSPRGYLGVTFDGAMMEIPRDGERVIRFYQYPRIALVEPSSPAERAGVREGDTLVALNGADVREKEISFTRLLVPDTRITMRVLRQGSSRNLKVTVGRAPDYYVTRIAPMPEMPDFPGMPSPMAAPMPARVRAVPQVAPAAPAMPTPMVSVWVANEGIGGAKVETLSEGLGKAFGAKTGVLVLKAAPGTPAYRSGLRDGDVVLEADGENVGSVRELRRVLQDSYGEDGVTLVILREKKKRNVTLRW